MNGYIAFYKGKRIEVYANTSAHPCNATSKELT